MSAIKSTLHRSNGSCQSPTMKYIIFDFFKIVAKHRTWKPFCATAWMIFISYEVLIGYDKYSSNHPWCPLSDQYYPNWYWYISYGVLGALITTLIVVLIKIYEINALKDRIPYLVGLNIILISTIATTLPLVLNWGLCIDVLGRVNTEVLEH